MQPRGSRYTRLNAELDCDDDDRQGMRDREKEGFNKAARDDYVRIFGARAPAGIQFDLMTYTKSRGLSARCSSYTTV